MAYATPADFVQAFGLDETCMLLMDEERLLTTDALASALEALAQGGAAADAVAARALERLQVRLHNTSSMMDGYLGSAVSLPIGGAGAALMGVLKECCLALARCALSDDPDNATEMAEAAWIGERVVERAIAMEGTCTGEHGIGLGKRKYLVREHGETAVDVMRAIKSALDPDELLNPGKVLPDTP